MNLGEPLVRLRHGTTRQRAEAIFRDGPDPNFREPGDLDPEYGFSTARVSSSCPYGSPETVAAGKALLFPAEGGPAILEMDVPESIGGRKADMIGEVRFELGHGLEELLAVWPHIWKQVLVP